MTSRAAESASGRHLLPLDGVRGLAILIVIIHNTEWVAGASEQFLFKVTSSITASGWVGVSLFFALSGFLITGILLDTKDKPSYFRSFYLRRTLRIFPLYYLAIAFTVFIAPFLAWSPGWIESVRVHQWSFWVYQSNWLLPFNPLIFGLSMMWSLDVEEQFYLLWPLVVRHTTPRHLIRTCVMIVLVTPFIRAGLRFSGLPAAVSYFWTIARWDSLAAGALVAALLREEAGRSLVSRWQGRVSLLAAALLVVQVGLQHGFHEDGFWTQVTGQSLVAVLSAALIAYAVERGPNARRGLQNVLSWSGLRSLGKYSYAMYVFHFPIHRVLSEFIESDVQGADTPWRFVRVTLYILMVLALSYLAARASWRLVEKPFLDLKDRIAPRPA